MKNKYNNLTKTNEILKTLRPEVGTSDKLALLKIPDRTEPHSLLLCNDNNTNYHIYSRYGQKVKKPIKIPIAIFEISFTICFTQMCLTNNTTYHLPLTAYNLPLTN